jgi:hypothetical protein
MRTRSLALALLALTACAPAATNTTSTTPAIGDRAQPDAGPSASNTARPPAPPQPAMED